VVTALHDDRVHDAGEHLLELLHGLLLEGRRRLSRSSLSRSSVGREW
jgi:hypothetical protein